MEEKKYYWAVYECMIRTFFSYRFLKVDTITTYHPISMAFAEKEKKENNAEKFIVLNWKEITKEEYDMALNS